MTTISESQSAQAQVKECLLRSDNSVSKKESPSFEPRGLAWEASTLPLSYTRPNHIYFSPKIGSCKEDWYKLPSTKDCHNQARGALGIITHGGEGGI